MRDRAADRLAKLGEAAVPPLAALLASDAASETKCAAVWALTRIESPAARAAVVAALDDGDPSVRQAAARAAGLHRDPAALARLAAIVGSDEPRRAARSGHGAGTHRRRGGSARPAQGLKAPRAIAFWNTP